MVSSQPAVLMQDGFGNPLSADLEFEAGFICNGVRATPTDAAARGMPGVGIFLEPDYSAGPRTRRMTTTSARALQGGICLTLSLGDDNLFQGDRSSGAAPDGGQSDKQLRALQLSLDVQRHALCDAAGVTAEIGLHF